MLYKDYLFKDFLHNFRYVFRIPKSYVFRIPMSEQDFFSWDDQVYRDFMIEVLQNLEPRVEEKGTILYRELEEISEIIFIESGIIDIGFEITRRPVFVLRMYRGTVIGAHNCC